MSCPKFAVGDAVVLDKRCPKWLKSRGHRQRARTVVNIVYSTERECSLYYLGNNNRADSPDHIPLRSYELRKATNTIGRPRTKRKYRKTGRFSASK